MSDIHRAMNQFINKSDKNTSGTADIKGYACIPYYGMCPIQFGRIFARHGIKTTFKSLKKIQHMLRPTEDEFGHRYLKKYLSKWLKTHESLSTVYTRKVLLDVL